MFPRKPPASRPTIDIDLAGRTSNELNHIAEIVRSVCDIAAEPAGIEFISGSVEVSRIKEDADYAGVRASLHATLAKARIPMQIDIGFGDVIVPGPAKLTYPTLLDFPAPVLQTYPKETVIAEKFEALTALGLLNSRLKDFYDLALLARLYPFDGEQLVEAIIATFRHRGTTIETEPVGLTVPTTATLRVQCSGGHLCAAAGSGRSPAILNGLWRMFVALHWNHLLRLRMRAYSKPRGEQVGRGARSPQCSCRT